MSGIQRPPKNGDGCSRRNGPLEKNIPSYRCRQRVQCVVKLHRPRECIRDAQLKLSRDLAAVACKVKDINRLLTLCVD